MEVELIDKPDSFWFDPNNPDPLYEKWNLDPDYIKIEPVKGLFQYIRRDLFLESDPNIAQDY